MSVRSKFEQWRNISRFCAQRFADYGELFRIELAETKARLLREVVAAVALAVGALFTLSFLCIAIIATAAGTPYFLAVVWAVAGTWLAITVIAFLAIRARSVTQPFEALHLELSRDIEAIKEASK